MQFSVELNIKKRLLLTIILLLHCFFLGACTSDDINSKDSPDDVSIIQLISNPEKYDGKYVRLVGVANLEFEGNGIYLHNEDLEYGISYNALWLELDEKAIKYEEAKKLNGKYVLIEGKFDMNDTGHLNAFSGAVVSIDRYELCKDKDTMEKMLKDAQDQAT